MQVTQSLNHNAIKKDLPSFGDALADIEKQAAASVGVDVPTLRGAVNFSSAGLLAPDGTTRDPFPPSLMAYLEVIRSITAYLREQGLISGGDNEVTDVAETITAATEIKEADEPTTFAIGEEEHDAAESGATPAIGEAARV